MNNYNQIQKVLHDIVLSKTFINTSLFEIEKIIYLKNIEIKNQSHIFISGLPRSGTTSLLNFIYSSNQYASLTYKNMPFLLSPHISSLFNRKDISKKQRMHHDQINYDNNSPEAFDEFFFNLDNKFINSELINYLQLICLSKNKLKYLSKNNLNFNRINLICELLPNCIFLIPIREPLYQAYSLLNQHLHFTKLQKKDDFIKRYMNYLGHYEFGLNHKPWNNPVSYQDSNNINYWLEQWCLFYQNILNNYSSHKNCYFVIYEKLIKEDYIKKLLKTLNINQIENIDLNYFKNSNNKEIKVNYSKNIHQIAKNIYDNFYNNFF